MKKILREKHFSTTIVQDTLEFISFLPSPNLKKKYEQETVRQVGWDKDGDKNRALWSLKINGEKLKLWGWS